MINLFIALMWTIAIFLLLEGRLFKMILGLALLSQAVNMVIFFGGGASRWGLPLLGSTAENLDQAVDPVPQALILTAIVISFVLFIFCVSLLVQVSQIKGKSHVREKLEIEREKDIDQIEKERG